MRATSTVRDFTYLQPNRVKAHLDRKNGVFLTTQTPGVAEEPLTPVFIGSRPDHLRRGR